MSDPTKPTEESERVLKEFMLREDELNVTNSDGMGPLTDTSSSSSSTNPYSNQPPLPFQDPNQNIYIMNIAHRQQRPVSKLPAFRICGGFRDVDKLKRHLKSCGGDQAYGGAAIHGAPAHKKILLCSSIDKQQDPSYSNYVMEKIEDISSRYLKKIDFHNREFQENKNEHRMGKTGQSKNTNKTSSRKVLLDKKFKELEKKGEETGEVSRIAEVRNQKVAVVTIMDDLTPVAQKGLEDPEPIIIIWGCFESELKAKHYILNTAQEKIKDVSLDVVNMYEWIFPTEIDCEQVEEQYRDQTLDKVMKARKNQKNAVLSFEDWCKNEGKEAPALEISAYKETEESQVETKIKEIEKLSADITVSTRKDATSSGKVIENLDQFEDVSGNMMSDKYKEMEFKEKDLVEDNPKKPKRPKRTKK